MQGSYRWNIWISSVGFLLTFLLSFLNNVLMTALIHSLFSFAILFVASYGFRYLLGFIIGNTESGASSGQSDTGSRIDLSTPDEEESMTDLIRQNLKGGESSSEQGEAVFSPLNPPRIKTKEDEKNPEDLANAVRQIAEN